MGQRAVRARRDDGRKRKPVRAMGQHIKLQLDGKLLLGHPLRDLRQDSFKGFAGDAAGLFDQRDLAFVLHLPEQFDIVVQGYPPHTRDGLLRVGERANRHGVVLVAQRGHAPLPTKRRRDLLVVLPLGYAQHRETGALALRLLHIAEIRNDCLTVCANQRDAFAGKPRQVEEIRRFVDDHRLGSVKG